MVKLFPYIAPGVKLPLGFSWSYVSYGAQRALNIKLPLPFVYKDINEEDWWYGLYSAEEVWGYHCLVMQLSWGCIKWKFFWIPFDPQSTI